MFDRKLALILPESLNFKEDLRGREIRERGLV